MARSIKKGPFVDHHLQSKVEAAFRDLKDPRMLSTRPQFHWTDQKLHVHAFVCVMAYLLVTLQNCSAADYKRLQAAPGKLKQMLLTIGSAVGSTVTRRACHLPRKYW